MFHEYKLVGIVGEGTYGQVYKALEGKELSRAPWYELHGSFAVKRQKLNNTKPDLPGVSSVSTLREVKLLKELKHPNIINLRKLIVDANELALVFEYADYEMMKIIEHYKGDLRESIPEFTLKSFVWQSLKGLDFLHENWVMHRDIKPENILIVGEGPDRGRVMLADLGLARIFKAPVLSLGIVDKVVVTLWYRAPELLLGAVDYTPTIDLWSLGCVFAALLLAKDPNVKALFQGAQVEVEEPTVVIPQGEKKSSSGPPFQVHQCKRVFEIMGFPTWPGVEQLTDYARVQNWNSEKGFPRSSNLRTKFSNDLSEDAFDLLSKMLEMNPASRITAADALKHRYFHIAPEPSDRSIDPPNKEPLKFPGLTLKPIDSALEVAQNNDLENRRKISQAKHEHVHPVQSVFAPRAGVGSSGGSSGGVDSNKRVRTIEE